MKVLIVAATRIELSGIYTHFSLPAEDFIQTKAFDILITGVGMTATAFALGQHLSAKTYHLVLNLGIAGCYEWKYPLGSLLNITTDTFSEFGAEDKEDFLPIDLLGFGKSTYAAYKQPDSASIANLPKVSSITVNKVHGNKHSISDIEKRLNPTLESMEGAAVFYCCEKLQVPVVQIRSISNYVEERNVTAWRIDLAVQRLNAWAIEYLTNR